MAFADMIAAGPDQQRIVITGVGLTAPNGNNLAEFRENLLAGRSGVVPYEIRYVGQTVAGICNFDELRYQKKRTSAAARGPAASASIRPTRRSATPDSTGRTSTSRWSAFTSA